MPNYIFLDTWVLSRYTSLEEQSHLSRFIEKNDYTILFTPIGAAEIYNPGWQSAPDKDRTVPFARFLSKHLCHIVRPETMYIAEIETFPIALKGLPITFSLDTLSEEDKLESLLAIFHRDERLLEHGIDIAKWAEDLKLAKKTWLSEVDNIIANGCDTGVLIKKNEEFIELANCKERFLVTLDNRHLLNQDGDDIFNLNDRQEPLKHGETRALPAIRFSSLCFWYAYIDNEKGLSRKREPSDVADFSNMSFIPYCSGFTIDKAMSHVAYRAQRELGYTCRLYTREALDAICLGYAS